MPAFFNSDPKTAPRRVLVSTALVLAISLLAAFLIYQVHPAWPLRRIFTRIAMIMALLVVIWEVRGAYGGDWRAFGFRPVRSWGFDLSAGALMAIVSGAGLLGLRFAAEGVEWSPIEPWEMMYEFAKGLVVALVVAIPEEIFFRGFVTGGFCRGWNRGRSVVASSVFFSVIHFVRPDIEVMAILPEAGGLFLMGMALSWLYLRTGTLSAAIGMHAGWIFVMKFDGALFRYTALSPEWLWGGERIAACLPAWPLFLAAVYFAWRIARAQGSLNIPRERMHRS